jgi:putative hydrolase of the HAD superfamily
MIKLFIFDLGKVLLHFDFKPAIEKLSKITPIDFLKVDALFRNSKFAEDWDKGLLSSEKFYSKIQETLHLPLTMDEFIPIWNDIFEEKKEMISLALRLKQNYKVVILSNTNPWHADYIRERYSWINNFDFFTSCDLHLMKPDPEIYNAVLKKAGAAPSETVYIDDLEPLINGAKKIGIDAILFQNSRHLFDELKKRKIDVGQVEPKLCIRNAGSGES